MCFIPESRIFWYTSTYELVVQSAKCWYYGDGLHEALSRSYSIALNSSKQFIMDQFNYSQKSIIG